jgi:hypothetical protein
MMKNLYADISNGEETIKAIFEQQDNNEIKSLDR